ncbi:L-serine ammonia-lyase [Mycetocola zhujimingii]|uniref:L-serine ammonia-lyase n=1 Tax=Mycetocola zhujimingii TaxID=2079792 RepID=UPI000D3C6D8C|nr:L-serine ammonia-lyase [Mycetocola zhujimingii]AWB87004.1 L-serine ammonia-lyase [Mycetocola zhujimingii]
MTAYVSAFELFSIGIGPSSSHTVGPMRAALDFASRLTAAGLLGAVDRVTCTLFGSLGSTGIGHGTPDAVVAGLAGLRPDTCDPAVVRGAWSGLRPGSTLALAGERPIAFEQGDITFEPRTRLPGHPNALTLTAWSAGAAVPLVTDTYYSVGGGFIRRDGDGDSDRPVARYPLPFPTAAVLLDLCASEGLRIDEVGRRNEEAVRSPDDVNRGLDAIWAAMAESVANGLATPGVLPGGLQVKRRAAAVREHLEIAEAEGGRELPTEWLHSFALAVNEENAAGGRVVTAPTNGAAGIIPAVASYYLRFVPGASADGIRRFLLTATAIGSLFKANASISGAVGGCQAEVGSACAMAAGALCSVLGGTPTQVENAAEIAMEHHLGLTCDPVGGLVQVPCIERNAIASSTAVSAARLALHGDGSHLVSLDAVIETMRQTGVDMSSKYKETSEGGLAVNVVEC